VLFRSGGASRKDLDTIAHFIRVAGESANESAARVLHSTPEAYFAARRSEADDDRPRFADHLNP